MKRFLVTILTIILSFTFFILHSTACTNLIVGKKASVDGSVIVKTCGWRNEKDLRMGYQQILG